MKNTWKFVGILVLTVTLGMGCKKEFIDPPTNKNALKTQALPPKKSSPPISFLVEKDDSRFGLHGTPSLTLQNVPEGTKQLVIMLEATDATATPKVLWVATASNTLKQIQAQGHGVDPTQVTAGTLTNIIPFYRAAGSKAYKTEVFALNRTLLPAETEKLKIMNRESFKNYILNPTHQLKLLASVEASKTKNKKGENKTEVIDEEVKMLEAAIKKTETAITSAEAAKQKVDEKYAAGSATGNTVKKAETKLTDLKSELSALKSKLTARHQQLQQAAQPLKS